MPDTTVPEGYSTLPPPIAEPGKVPPAPIASPEPAASATFMSSIQPGLAVRSPIEAGLQPAPEPASQPGMESPTFTNPAAAPIASGSEPPVSQPFATLGEASAASSISSAPPAEVTPIATSLAKPTFPDAPILTTPETGTAGVNPMNPNLSPDVSPAPAKSESQVPTEAIVNPVTEKRVTQSLLTSQAAWERVSKNTDPEYVKTAHEAVGEALKADLTAIMGKEWKPPTPEEAWQ